MRRSRRLHDEPTGAPGDAGPATGAPVGLRVSAPAGVSTVQLARGAAIVLGRAQEATVPIDDRSVSRLHARFTYGERLTVADLGSRNGTRVDGRPIASGEEAAVGIGSVIVLGAVTVVVQPLTAALARPPAGESPPTALSGGGLVCDPAMIQLVQLVHVIAPSTLSVLLLGETGVGKELLAEELHALSRRADQPFVKLNCAAIPEAMLEAELFGYEKGAFTGAVHAKPGLLETAHGGTAFLDEIGEVPLAMQAKLLRAIESGEVLRLGSVKPRAIDVRLISATNRDLHGCVGQGTFRADLYFRINGVSLTVPPLRKRPTEILPLAGRFLDVACARLGKVRPLIGADAQRELEAYAWPGNVRELRNVIERAAVICQKGELVAAHLMLAEAASVHLQAPASADGAASPTEAPPGLSSHAELQAKFEDMEKGAILAALEKAAGNQSQAAKLLGITRRALVYRLEQYGITRPRKPVRPRS
jgi:two-component system response regulator AtoC